MIFDQLYRTSRLDGLQAQLRWFQRTVTQGNAAATVTGVFTNDLGAGLWLALVHAVMTADPGAGQNYTALRLRAQTPVSDSTMATVDVLADTTAGAADANRVLTFTGLLLVPPMHRLIARGDFNAGANSNAMVMHLHGFLIPQGNLIWA